MSRGISCNNCRVHYVALGAVQYYGMMLQGRTCMNFNKSCFVVTSCGFLPKGSTNFENDIKVVISTKSGLFSVPRVYNKRCYRVSWTISNKNTYISL